MLKYCGQNGERVLLSAAVIMAVPFDMAATFSMIEKSQVFESFFMANY